MANENNVNNEAPKRDSYLEDIVSKASKENKELSKEEIASAVESTQFLNKMEEIDLSDDSYRVIFTDGQKQLLYDDGEFFEISTTDSNGPKKKIGKTEARNMYIEYFIKYVLNPMINKAQRQKGVRAVKKVIRPQTKTRTVSKKSKSREDDMVL